MITITIPTMWNFEPFLDFISDLVELNIISKIIIINNNRQKTPQHTVLNHHKINLIDVEKNIYVNPAWNLGVQLSDTEWVCIMNDDLIFDAKIFYKILTLQDSNVGAIGLNSGKIEFGQTPVTTGEINFEPYTNQNCQGFGELIFIKKSTWVDIPEEIKIAFGDNFIFDSHYFKGRQNYFMSNMFHYHAVSLTSTKIWKEETLNVYNQEKLAYEKIKVDMMNNR